MDDHTFRARRHLAAIGLFALLLTLPAGVVQADVLTPATDCDTVGADGNTDAGNSMATAAVLDLPATCAGSLTLGTDEQDWFKLVVTVGRQFSTMEVISEAPLFATDVRILDSAGNLAINPDTAEAFCADGTPRDTCPQWKAQVNATYYLVLTREVGSGTYTLVADGMQAQNDCHTAGDTGDSSEGFTPSDNAKRLTLFEDPAGPGVRSIACDGIFDRLDLVDSYTFYVAAGTIVEIDLTGVAKTTIDTWVLSDPAGISDLTRTVCPSDPPDTATTWGRHVCKPPDVSGFYHLKLNSHQARNQGLLAYAFTLRVIQDDCASSPSDPSESPVDAPDAVTEQIERLLISGACTGTLDGEPSLPTGTAIPLDPKDQLRLDSDVTALSFTAVPPTLNCITLRVKAPGAAAVNASACAAINPDDDGPSNLATLTVPGAASGFWEIDVILGSLSPGAPASSHKGGVYSLAVQGILGYQDDCGNGADLTAPHTIDVPVRVDEESRLVNETRERSCSGDLRATNDIDTYKIPGVAQSDILTVDLGTSAANVCLTGPDSVSIGCGRSHSVRADTPARAGTWTAVVQGPAPAATPYTLSVSILSQTDCGNLSGDPENAVWLDAGNDPSKATALGQVASPADTLTGEPAIESQTCAASTTPGRSGVLRHAALDNADWYSVELVNQYTGLIATMVQETAGDPRIASDFDLCVIAPGAAMRCSSDPPSIPEVVIATATCPTPQGPSIPTCAGSGTWKIGVIYKAGPLGAYRLAIAGRN